MKKLMILFPLIMLTTLLLGQKTPSPKAIKEKEQLNHSKAAPNTEKPMDNPYKDLKYGNNGKATEHTPEEAITEVADTEEIHAENKVTLPKDGNYWKLNNIKASTDNSKITKEDLQIIQNDMDNSIKDKQWTWIMTSSEIYLVSEEASYKKELEVSDRSYTFIPEHNCKNCPQQTFTIIKETSSKLILSTTYGGEREGITSTIYFNKIIQP